MEMFTSMEFWELAVAVGVGVFAGKAFYAFFDGLLSGFFDK